MTSPDTADEGVCLTLNTFEDERDDPDAIARKVAAVLDRLGVGVAGNHVYTRRNDG